MKFVEKLKSITEKNNSLVCVGLDSELSKIPQSLQGSANPQFEFNKAIIDATADLVCAYKPNAAFYEAEGVQGLEALHKTIEYIPSDIPVILDAKRGDIGNTSRLYAQASFESLGADAVTVHPYMGTDTVAPFLEYEDKAIFVLAKTSNASAVEIEDLETTQAKKVYMHVVEMIAKWNADFSGCAGAVVGATYPEDLREVRALLPQAPILIPGVGKQGGALEKTIKYGGDADKQGMLINSSRGIIFCSNGEDFKDAARQATQKLRDEINSVRG